MYCSEQGADKFPHLKKSAIFNFERISWIMMNFWLIRGTIALQSRLDVSNYSFLSSDSIHHNDHGAGKFHAERILLKNII